MAHKKKSLVGEFSKECLSHRSQFRIFKHCILTLRGVFSFQVKF